MARHVHHQLKLLDKHLPKLQNHLPQTIKSQLTCHRLQSSSTVTDASLSANDVADDVTDYNQARPFEEIPGPRGLPFIGTLLKYKLGKYRAASYHKALLEHHHRYGRIFRETLAGSTVVHLLCPDLIKAVYLAEGKIPHIPPLLETTQMYRKYRGLSPGLGNTNGEEWYRLRSAVQQMMMRPKAVSMYLPGVNQVADDFVQRLESIRDHATGHVTDFRNEILKWQLESSAMTSFEMRLGSMEAGPASHQQRLLDANAAIFANSLRLKFSVPLYKYIQTPTWRRLVQAEDYFFGNGQKLVDEAVARIRDLVDTEQLKDGQYGFLIYLLGRKELSYKDLSIITLSLFSDGLSTTVPTLIGQLYCLASNPEKQEKLYREIKEVVPRGSSLTPKILSRLTYLKACIKEGFRFFPIGTEVSRIPQRDLVLAGYQIPAGTHLELNNNMLLRLPTYFTEPDCYEPERWVRGDSQERASHPYLLIPFGHGPRMCAGRRFAEQEMQVLMTKLVSEYRLEWSHGDMEQNYNMLLTPSQTAHFRLTKRR